MKHGGDLHDAKAKFPEAPEPWIDLSTGINPQAYPFSALPPEASARLPATGAVRDLEAIAARAYGAVDPAQVVAAGGTQALIELLPRLRPPGRVAILGPTYTEHAECWARAGHVCLPAADLAQALATRPDVVILVNPNNPDGRVIPGSDLARAAQALHDRAGWLVVDEAFADLEDGVSVVPRLGPAMIVLRSFGKTYGLAGIRLGFAIATTVIADTIRPHLGLWSISGPALAIGAEALADPAWLLAQKRALRLVCHELDHLLVEAGLTIEGGTWLFRLARHPDALTVFSDLAQAGIWVRPFSHDPNLLRFGIPLPEALPRLATALGQRAR
ncbi:threonine-phosphate decarboxylase CobD [Microvirga antarctica]|uniref:threonine-phosphate decarboxylase CobD n=1 Tax=Microvirga antarctica TaxID=2819233 RepID=UPI0031BB7862